MTDAQQNSPSNENEDRALVDRGEVDARAVTATRDPYGRIGAYAGNAPETHDGLGLDLREYWRILNKRKTLIASIAAAFLAIGLIWTLMQTPLYTATVRLQIERNVAKIVESGNVTPTETFDLDFLKTQYELLQSRSLAERVASMTRLADDPEFNKPVGSSILSIFGGSDKTAPGSQQSGREIAAAKMILDRRVVRPVPGSRLVDVSYSDPDPARALRIAAAYGEGFIASNLDKRFQANAYAKTFLEDQIKQLKLRLEDAEKVLLEFAEKEQIVATADKTSIAESNLAAANAALGNIISERIKNEQLWKQVQNETAINLPQLLTNSVIDGLRVRRNQLVTEYQEKSETFRADYPAMVQISNKIKETDRQLATEVKTIRSSLKAAYESSLSQENEMKQRIETLRADALDLQKRSIQYNILKREVDTTRSLYEGLLQRFKEVDVAGGAGANNVFIVDKAELPRQPSSPVMSRALALSLALGLAAGLAAAFVLERLDDIVHSPEEAERVFGLAMLGVIPKITPPQTIESELADPRSALAEAYRSLCTALQFSTTAGLPKTLLATSAAPGEGKSTTSLAMARHFSVLGLKVLIIDADLRNASLHKRLGLENGVGLSNYLTENCSALEAIQRTELANFFFMASGPLPPNAADLLSGPRLLSLLSTSLEVFDLIVIDGPPVMGLADAPILSNAAAATVLVMSAGETKMGAVRNALKRLEMARTPIIGAVVNKFDAKTAGYGYGYGYGYTYGESGERSSGDKPDDAGKERQQLRKPQDASS
ncbi:GumC family protein [Methylocystis sp.]|uniref:GumC family protein n=1 Tax=Methylocystis sp. TaxID=1911079 RepID=UPI003DA2CF14